MAAGTSVARCFPDVGGTWPRARAVCSAAALDPVPAVSRVVAVYDEASVTSPPAVAIQAARVAPMLDRAMAELTDGASTPWREIFPDYGAGMKVGLKVNTLNGFVPTSVPVVQAVISGLQRDLGIPKGDIIVWDRRQDELTRAGLTPEVLGTQVLGTVTSTTDLSGPGYEDCYCEVSAGKRVRFSRILTELTDVTINCPVLKTHEVSGVTAALKNVYGVIDNPGDFHNDLNTALPAIYALAPIRERFRFTVLDALIAVVLGGTASESDSTPRRLAVARDPLALDSYALDLVNELRAADGSMLPVPAALLGWVDQARDLGLGTRQVELRPIVL